jgi:phosphatidylinositol alpha 1,6-mannosyltransferase
VLPNGIDVAPWRQSAPVARISGRLRLVTVARLAPRKRVAELVKGMARARVLLEPDVHLDATIVGDGPLRTHIEHVARRERLDVRFTGRLDPDGIRAVFARSDAFVQASVRESFGIAALEARTWGLPVIARTQSGTSEFVRDGVEGLLAPDDAGLGDAMARLGRDPSLGERISAYNVMHEPDQTWPRVRAEAQRLYVAAGA